MNRILKAVLGSVLALLLSSHAGAQTRAPRLAVTDLAYEEQVGRYVQDDGVPHSPDAYDYINRGELRKFTADIKGGVVRSGMFELVQPHLGGPRKQEQLYDIVARIKRGEFNGADYVLFGTISSIQSRQEENPLDKTDTVSHTLSMELVGEFSLISTRSNRVKASFTATGSGQDVKLANSRGGRLVMNRGRVVADVSKSLGEDVVRQLLDQLGGPEDAAPVQGTAAPSQPEKDKVIIFR